MSYKSRRCTRCGTNWPIDGVRVGDETVEFNACPDCGVSTRLAVRECDVDPDQFRRDYAYKLFEQYLERRENADRDLIERVEPVAFAQYLMDSAAEQIDRDRMT